MLFIVVVFTAHRRLEVVDRGEGCGGGGVEALVHQHSFHKLPVR